MAFALGDLDGRGVVERVDVRRSGDGPANLVLARGDGAGGFGAPEVVATNVGSGVANDVEVGNVDGDRVGGVVAGRYGVPVFGNDGTGAFTMIGPEGVPCVVRPDEFIFEAADIEIADRDGDGVDDVVLVGYCHWSFGPGPTSS